MKNLKRVAWIVAALTLLGISTMSGLVGYGLGRQMLRNELCCKVPRSRNVVLSAKEMLRLVRFPSQIGQDKWVAQTVFPGVKDGFFLDVGSADGTVISNTWALEQLGWRGVCIDPFPKNMQGRTCQVFKEVGDAGQEKPATTAGSA